MANNTLLQVDIPDLKLFRKGKVRNVYDLGGRLLFIVSDRISAFDVVMKNGIPDKGKLLNSLSLFWFNFTGNIIDNHVISADTDEIISIEPALEKHRNIIDGRSMLVRKTKPLTVECIVRGYISGSGWKDYSKTGMISGVKLPRGLKESEKLNEPIFTPSTKADTGHDENISEDDMREKVGDEVFAFLKKKSVEIYVKAGDYALSKGIIIADTKFEFGYEGNKLILIDEILTPDSSRFWPLDDYEPGRAQKSFDKQFVRDYLETINWDKTPPGPELPADIVAKTREKYVEAYRILTGKEF